MRSGSGAAPCSPRSWASSHDVDRDDIHRVPFSNQDRYNATNRQRRASLEDRQMSTSSHALCRGALRSAVAVALLAGCATNDSISTAEKTDAIRPGIAETKAIAEEGFIYGLPIVMNYAVMY